MWSFLCGVGPYEALLSEANGFAPRHFSVGANPYESDTSSVQQPIARGFFYAKKLAELAERQ